MTPTFIHYKIMSYMSAAAAGVSFIGLIKAATTANTTMSLLNLLFMFLNIYFATKANNIYEEKVFIAIANYVYEHRAEIEEKIEKGIKEKLEHEHN